MKPRPPSPSQCNDAPAEQAARGKLVEDYHNAFMDAAADQFFELNGQGLFLMGRSGASSTAALPVEHFLGRTINEVFPSELAANYFLGIEAALLTGRAQVFEHSWETKNAGRRQYEARIKSLPNGNVLLILRDNTSALQISERLRDQEELFRGFFEENPEALWLCDEQGRVQLWNLAAERLTGYGSEEVVGKLIWEFLLALSLPEHRKQEHQVWMEEAIRYALREPQAVFHQAWEGPFQHKNGKTLWVRQVAFPIQGDQGNRLGLLLYDITERRAQEQALLRFKQGVEQSNASVVITNLKGDIEYVNTKFSQVSGYSFEEALGKNPRILKSGLIAPRYYEELWTSLLKGQEWHGEFYNKRKDGSCYWELASISAIHDANGVPTGYLAVKEDITERKAVEESLLLANKELQATRTDLESRVAERTAQINALLGYKDELIRHLGHDLRTPLTPLVGLMPVLLESEANPGRRKILKLMVSNAEHIRRITDSILDLSRLGDPNFSLNQQSVSVRPLVERIITAAAKRAGKTMVMRNQVPEGLVVLADVELLVRIYEQLLDNAARFTVAEGLIELGGRQEGDTALLWVRDHGVGLAPESAQKIFEPFYKSDEARHSLGSVGVGLSFCQKVLERHGGSIWAESRGPGLGTTLNFKLSLPKAAFTGAFHEH